MHYENLILKFSNAILKATWKVAFRPEYAPHTLRRNFEWVSGISSQALLKKYPHAQFIESRINGVRTECIQTTESPQKTILYLHGGGYIMGSIHAYRRNMLRIAYRCQARVMIPEYRLAPEYPFPAALEDAKQVYSELSGRYDPGQIVFMGDSAGGGLVLAVLMALRDEGKKLPAGALCASPWTDLLGTGASMETNAGKDVCLSKHHLKKWAPYYPGSKDPKLPYISPVNGDFRALPPLMILVGDQEMLLDDSVRVAKKAAESGVRVTLRIEPGMQHVWFLSLPWLRQSKEAMNHIAQFVQNIS
ncbi:MAG: alpha/beta hydrolase [Deltaproteobacteria bacterium]|nr:alpha/beta hydrolase [Deltaproteobacteria bacterium]